MSFRPLSFNRQFIIINIIRTKLNMSKELKENIRIVSHQMVSTKIENLEKKQKLWSLKV
jgi:predicted ATP-grasp superfamily ATP-dependent carboligase